MRYSCPLDPILHHPCVFRISENREDRFPWNLSRFIGVIGGRKRIKTSEKFRPLMCKNSENCAKLPTSRKSPQSTHAGVRNGLRFEFASSPERWPVVRQRHGTIARRPGAWPVALSPVHTSDIVAKNDIGCVLFLETGLLQSKTRWLGRV